MLQFEIVQSSLKVTNGATVILLIAKQDVYINPLAVQGDNPTVQIYNINLGTVLVLTQPLSQCADSTGTPFTPESFILFAEENLGFNGGGTPQPSQSVTYAEINALIQDGLLNPNSNYLISDFQTIYDQPDYSASDSPKPPESINTLSGEIEPLIVYAISENTISNVALSTLYRNDVINYEWSFDYTEYTGTPAKGLITKRITAENNNLTLYDSRAVVFKRYLDITTNEYTVYYDNGNSFIDTIPTFGAGCKNMFINGNSVNFAVGDYPFYMPNNIFGANGSSVNTESVFFNNTIGDNCDSNSFGNTCFGNVIGLGCAYNNVSEYFTYNNIGRTFTGNTIGNQFQSNIIGNQFQNNTIGNICIYNTIAIDFNLNIIANNFSRNIIGGNFQKNIISLDFGASDGEEVGGNTIGSGFSNNQINGSFVGNSIANNFQYNILNIAFAFNTIEVDNFQYNSIFVVINQNQKAINLNAPQLYLPAYCQVIESFEGDLASGRVYLTYLSESGSLGYIFIRVDV